MSFRTIFHHLLLFFIYLTTVISISDRPDAASMLEGAACEPELQTISLATKKEPGVIYVPECVRVKRCGGCCRHDMLSCQPIPDTIKMINLQLYKSSAKMMYLGGKKSKYFDKELVVVESHTKCKCRCKIKQEDCNEFQEYRPAGCHCVCKNLKDQTKCQKRPEKMFWNPDLCRCQCLNVAQCSTGYYFDHAECKCMLVSLDKNRYPYNGIRQNKEHAK